SVRTVREETRPAARGPTRRRRNDVSRLPRETEAGQVVMNATFRSRVVFNGVLAGLVVAAAAVGGASILQAQARGQGAGATAAAGRGGAANDIRVLRVRAHV